MKLERFYDLASVQEKFYPSRSTRWIKDTFRTGEFGPVLRAPGGWEISETALETFQRLHLVQIVRPVPDARIENLVQFAKVAPHKK